MATCEDRNRLPRRVEVDFIKAVNDQLGILYGQLNDSSLPAFGSNLLLCDNDSICAATVAHRVLNKFQVPDDTRSTMLHDLCVAEWLQAEERFSTFSWDDVPLKSKSVLYRARSLLAEWLAPFKRGKDVEFTPGETLVANRGRTSVYQKLRNKDAWTVTHDAFSDFARLVYNNRYLKKVAKTFFHPLTRSQQRRLYDVFKDSKHVGYAVFEHRFEHEVVTKVYGGRFSSVYKNNEKRRPIIVAPLGNMLLQRTVSQPLRDILRHVGNDLEIGQDVHKMRISNPNVATIDFSNASDSNLLKVVTSQFPSQVSRLLRRYRDPMVLVGEDYVIPHKLSSMGCGFTFEVMTLLLLSIARVFDPEATVYGDDVIIRNDCAAAFVEVMGDIMWTVNQKKSFINSQIRESCGAFYLDGYGYITCYDLKFCENINDAVITMNKLSLISGSNVPLIGNLFRASHEALLRIAPALLMGPAPYQFTQPDLGYIVTDRASRIQRRNKSCQSFWSRFAPRTLELLDRFQLSKHEATIVLKPKFVNDLASKTLKETRETARTAFYLYNNGVSDDPIRNKGEWRYAVHVVTPSGVFPVNLSLTENRRWDDLTQKAYARMCWSVLFFCWTHSVLPGKRVFSRANDVKVIH